MIRIKKTSSDSGTSFWRLLGTKVLSASGEYCGRITGVNVSAGKVAGFQLIYRFETVFIDSNYVTNMESLARETSVILSETPFYTMLGKSVYDKNGRKLGKVRFVEQRGIENDFEAIIVKGSVFSRSKRIENARVEIAKKSVIVKLVQG